MEIVYFATRVRGFFKHLFSHGKLEFEFIGNNNGFYEVNSRKRKLISLLARNPLFDWLGVIQVIKCKDNSCTINGSFNRFLNSDKPYFIYLENPTALFHYRLKRNKWLGKKKVTKYLNDSNLKGIICMSYACYDTFDSVCGKWQGPEDKKIVIYPFVPQNCHVTDKVISERSKRDEINLLFIAQGIRFKSKGGLEVLESFKKLYSNNKNIGLTIVTSIKDLDKKTLKLIKDCPNLNLLDFNLTYQKLEELYAKSTLLLQPTSDDSFGMTILEGMKAGLPVIATNLYAIPEMVKDGLNGYLTNPHWWFFDKNNIPNPKVWNHRKQTIYSGEIDNNITNFIYEKVNFLIENREVLYRMSLSSYKIANSAPFDEDSIINSWNNILKSIREPKDA